MTVKVAKQKYHQQTGVTIGLWIETFSFFSFCSLQAQALFKVMLILEAQRILPYIFIRALGVAIFLAPLRFLVEQLAIFKFQF